MPVDAEITDDARLALRHRDEPHAQPRRHAIVLAIADPSRGPDRLAHPRQIDLERDDHAGWRRDHRDGRHVEPCIGQIRGKATDRPILDVARDHGFERDPVTKSAVIHGFALGWADLG